ncbi:MAG TPA: hypothetical protein VFU49_04085 [Ktedonobacteraceae bacterium]|nr:hypothetical protein [Ktedonobacteraceae bacterium]
MQRQQQQPAEYDLLAVFPDETRAEEAASKLRNAGFDNEEVYQLPSGLVGNGQFREHGPNRTRSEFFLQTQRSGPNPLLVITFAIISCLILGGLTFAASFALPTLPEPVTIIVGAAIGLILGAILGLLRRGRVRGAIGQTIPSAKAASGPPPGGLTVVALRFADPENISKKSRARAILLNNQGKIDRSVGRRE